MNYMPYGGVAVKPIPRRGASLVNQLLREARLQRCQREPWRTYRIARKRIARYCHVTGGRCFGDAELFDRLLTAYRAKAGL